MEKYTHFDFLPVQFRYIINLLGRQWIARAIALTLVVFVAAFIFALISPVAGEPFFYNLSNLSGLLTFTFAFLISCAVCGFAAFVVSFCLSLSVRMAYQDIGETMKRNRDNAPASLDAWNIHPDIPVFQSLDETDTEFERRISNARLKVNDEAWAVVLRFRKIEVKVDDNSAKGMYNTRSGEGSFFPLLTDQQVTTETEQEYNARLNEFCREWQPFAQREKLSRIKGNVFAKTLQSSANVLVFCLLSLAALGQNTAKIHNALGAADKDKIESGAKVHYVFTDGSSVTRTADGAKTISQLFATNYPGAESRKVGEVDGISINGVAIPLQKIVIASNGTPQQPATLFADGSAQPIKKSFLESIPDSAAAAKQGKVIMSEGEKFKAKLWRSVAPWWEVAMWFFGSIFWLIAGFGGLSWYFADTAKKNGNLGYSVLRIQRASSRNVLFACWAVTSVVLINIFLFFISWDIPIWCMILCWFGVLGLSAFVTNKLTPNGKVVEFDEGIARFEQQRAQRAINRGN